MESKFREVDEQSKVTGIQGGKRRGKENHKGDGGESRSLPPCCSPFAPACVCWFLPCAGLCVVVHAVARVLDGRGQSGLRAFFALLARSLVTLSRLLVNSSQGALSPVL